MAAASSSSSLKKLLPLGRLSRALKPPPSSRSSSSLVSFLSHRLNQSSTPFLNFLENSIYKSPLSIASKSLCSRPLNHDDESQGPAAIDYRSLLQEDEFHRLADSTLNNLQERFEEYADCIQIDGFDIDYGNQVLTLKLGTLGTYVVNKQTPNRQIWLSSPVSGPSRYDWDWNSQAWIYRRNKAKLLEVLEKEVEELCGKPISLS
ncbi:frataxin, mitochondrial isoform X2 [Malania oleifera]|uniref:frataxin, mitochondrial isoform X2 n=1 Tax=Malania oleifera TaxID=397392 RepID=UPI0025AE902D|nr:frataxin, mitochondrial isoform X2 [Malania oleifera]